MRDYERLRKTLGNLVALHDCAIDGLREPMREEAETVWNETPQTSEMERLVAWLEAQRAVFDGPPQGISPAYNVYSHVLKHIHTAFGYGEENK